MAVTVTKAYVQTFEANVRHIAQQSKSRLRQFVTEKQKGATSKDTFPRIGTIEFAAKSTRGTSGRVADTPLTDIEWSNRVAVPAVQDAGTAVEPEDLTRILADPRAESAIAIGNGGRRAIDTLIITAAGGAALDEAGGSNTFPAGQKVGGSTTAFDFSIPVAVQAKFLGNNIDPETPKVMVVSPAVAVKLLQMTEATSSDYVNAKALANDGYVRSWMGFTWVCSTLLPLAAGGTTRRYLYAFTRQAIGLLVNKDLYIRVGEDVTKSFMYRIYGALDMGAVRVEDEHIVQVEVDEAL